MTAEIVHACPEKGSAVTGCCGITPFELDPKSRMTVDPELVTCRGAPMAGNLYPALTALDVAGKVVVLTFPTDPPAYFGPMIGGLAEDLRDSGAVSVIVLTNDVALTALSDEELASAGLQRIPETLMIEDRYQPTRWWRATAPDGSVWCESSDEQEVRRSMRTGDRLTRLYQTFESQWRDTPQG